MIFDNPAPGDRLHIRADVWRQMQAAAQRVRDLERRLQGVEQRSVLVPDTILLRNNSARNIPQYGVLGLDVPLASAQTIEFRRSRAVRGAVPNEITHFGRFAILQRDVRRSGVAPAIVAGLTPVRVLVTMQGRNWRFADVAHGQTTHLKLCPIGSAEVVWREQGFGLRWALVRLAPAPTRPVALVSCEDSERIIYTQAHHDLITQVVRIEEETGCWQVLGVTCERAEGVELRKVTIIATATSCSECDGCFELVNCDDPTESLISNTPGLSDWSGKVVYGSRDSEVGNDKCWTVTPIECSQTLEPFHFVEGYEDCQSCGTCWEIEKCWEPGATKLISNNLPQHLGMTTAEILEKQPVLLSGGECWKVLSQRACSQSSEQIEIDGTRENCGECGCWQLMKCPGGAGYIYVRSATNTAGDPIDLGEYVNQVVRRMIDGQPDVDCYLIKGNGAELDPDNVQDLCAQAIDIVVAEVYESSCTNCLFWQIERCDDPTVTLWTYTDLPGVLGGDVLEMVGVVFRDDSNVCWKVIGSQLAVPPDSVAIEVDREFPTCTDCLQQSWFVLSREDCIHEACDSVVQDDDLDLPRRIYTRNGILAGHEGEYTHWRGYCWKIERCDVECADLTEADDTTLEGWGEQFFETCAACLAAGVTAKLPYVLDVRRDSMGILRAYKQSLVVEQGRIVAICDEPSTAVGCECSPVDVLEVHGTLPGLTASATMETTEGGLQVNGSLPGLTASATMETTGGSQATGNDLVYLVEVTMPAFRFPEGVTGVTGIVPNVAKPVLLDDLMDYAFLVAQYKTMLLATDAQPPLSQSTAPAFTGAYFCGYQPIQANDPAPSQLQGDAAKALITLPFPFDHDGTPDCANTVNHYYQPDWFAKELNPPITFDTDDDQYQPQVAVWLDDNAYTSQVPPSVYTLCDSGTFPVSTLSNIFSDVNYTIFPASIRLAKVMPPLSPGMTRQDITELNEDLQNPDVPEYVPVTASGSGQIGASCEVGFDLDGWTFNVSQWTNTVNIQGIFATDANSTLLWAIRFNQTVQFGPDGDQTTDWDGGFRMLLKARNPT